MKLIKISKKMANDFYLKYEHLGNCGLGVWHYGLFKKDELLSVVSYGTTCFNNNRGFLANLSARQNTKIIQLARGGTKFDAPSNIPSQIIKQSLKALRDEFGNTLIIAYSDALWNEIGTIYQACNFHYLGLTEPGGQCNYAINGEHMSGWIVRKRFGTRDVSNLEKMGLYVVRFPLNPKHRYLYINTTPLKKKFILKSLVNHIQTYPKRASFSVGSMLEIRKHYSHDSQVQEVIE